MAKKELYGIQNVQVLNMKDLRKVYAHARQIGWTMSNYSAKVKCIDDFTVAIQKEFSRRGKKLPY